MTVMRTLTSGFTCSQSGSRLSSTSIGAVLGVVDDVGELVGVEAEVERVEHAAHERDGEVGLEVRAVIPAERGDAVAGDDAEVEEDAGRGAGRGAVKSAHGVAVNRLVREARDDFLPAEDCFGAAEDRRQGERVVHHQAVHGPDCMRNACAGAETSREASTRRAASSPPPGHDTAILRSSTASSSGCLRGSRASIVRAAAQHAAIRDDRTRRAVLLGVPGDRALPIRDSAELRTIRHAVRRDRSGCCLDSLSALMNERTSGRRGQRPRLPAFQVEALARDPQCLSARASTFAAMSCRRGLDHLALDRGRWPAVSLSWRSTAISAAAVRGLAEDRAARREMSSEMRVRQQRRVRLGERDHAAHFVLQLADVARPAIEQQPLHRFFGDADAGLS